MTQTEICSPCEVCWTNSWVPVEESDPDAEKLRDGSYARCDMCWMRNQAAALRLSLDQANEQLRFREWQPIETAPKDGTHLLAYRPGWHMAEAWWRADVPDAGWGGYGWFYPSWDQPTHWQPLPAAPAQPSREVK